MPWLQKDSYSAPSILFNRHIETVYPAIFRKVRATFPPKTSRVQTPDEDFFELDYYENDSDKTVIISHGLEGNSNRPYIIGMANAFLNAKYNVIAWNYRGCNGQINNSIKSYHSGFTEDLEEVIRFADLPHIKALSLIGFSLGGNLTLKYLGNTNHINSKIRNAVAVSVPLDLYQSCMEISKPSNFLYSKRFLKTLKQKIREKATKFPEIETRFLNQINDLKTFDDYYTAPLHGFNDAMDYYRSCSSLYVLEDINTPALVINALNDPFLPDSCYPNSIFTRHKYLTLETPAHGGHVGFTSFNKDRIYWSEKRSLEFIESTG